MKSIRRRLAAAVLSLAVVLSMMPAAAFTAWADEGGDQQLEVEEEKPAVSLGDEIELDSLIVGYSSEQAAENKSDIVLTNTGNCDVTIYPDKLSFSNSKFKWTKTIDESVTLKPDETVTVATVEPKAGLAADWYYGYVYYRDYEGDNDLYSKNSVYLAVLKDGLSLDVYDEDDDDITLFDLGCSIRGSNREVSQEFWITNDGNVPFRLSFTSTNDLFRVEQKTKQDVIGKDDDVLCNIKVDPARIAGLAAGTYTGYVTARATAENGKTAEETIPVTFKVTEKPKWTTSEASDFSEVDTYLYGTALYLDNIEAFAYAEEDYLKAVVTEGSDIFEMSDYIYSSGYTYIYPIEDYLDKGVYTAKIKLLYDPTGSGDFSNAEDLGTMTFTLSVVEKGTFALSLESKGYDPETEILDLGVLTTGYTEEDAKKLEATLSFENSGKEDLDVSGKGFGYYFYENGKKFVWNEGSEAATLKPGEKYSEIKIRPQTGMEAGSHYDYFYFEDDNERCYTEFVVRYLVADKGQTMRVVDTGGLFDEPKDIESGQSVVYDSSYIDKEATTYYKWINIYNTGKDPFWLSVDIPAGGTCNGIYNYSTETLDNVEVKPGDYKMLRIILDTKTIAGKAGTYNGKFKISIKDESGENAQTRTVPVSYTITDQTYHVSMDLQGKGNYGKNKVEADFPAGTTYRSALSKLNSMIVGDSSNLWPVDDEYTVVAFTKNPDSAYSSWDQLIAAQKEVSDQEISEDTAIYVNWAKKIKTADVTAKLPVCGTTAGTAVAASVDKDAPYSLDSVSWKDVDDKVILEGDEGYPLEVNLDAKFGYAFSTDSNIRINGVFATRTSSSSSVNHGTANRVVMIGHDWDEGKVTKEATADSEGVKTFTCRHCKKTKTEAIPKVDISDGTKHSTAAGTVRIISKENRTAAFVKPEANKKKVTIPETVDVAGKTFTITAIDAGAFKGQKTTTLTVKTKKLTKKSVKGSLKGSKIKTVKVKVGKKSVNKKYVKKYKKIFTKKNAGKKVKVK